MRNAQRLVLRRWCIRPCNFQTTDCELFESIDSYVVSSSKGKIQICCRNVASHICSIFVASVFADLFPSFLPHLFRRSFACFSHLWSIWLAYLSHICRIAALPHSPGPGIAGPRRIGFIYLSHVCRIWFSMFFAYCFALLPHMFSCMFRVFAACVCAYWRRPLLQEPYISAQPLESRYSFGNVKQLFQPRYGLPEARPSSLPTDQSSPEFTHHSIQITCHCMQITCHQRDVTHHSIHITHHSLQITRHSGEITDHSSLHTSPYR